MNLTEEEVLKEWDIIYELFKANGVEPRFFYKDISIWDKVSFNDEYALFYFQFNLQYCTDKYLLLHIGEVVSGYQLNDYVMSIDKKECECDNWRLVITLKREANTFPIS